MKKGTIHRLPDGSVEVRVGDELIDADWDVSGLQDGGLAMEPAYVGEAGTEVVIPVDDPEGGASEVADDAVEVAEAAAEVAEDIVEAASADPEIDAATVALLEEIAERAALKAMEAREHAKASDTAAELGTSVTEAIDAAEAAEEAVESVEAMADIAPEVSHWYWRKWGRQTA